MVISLPLEASGQPLSLTSTRVGFSQWGMSRTVTFTGRMTDSLLWSRHEVAHSDPEEKQSVRQLLDLVSWHPWAALRKCGLCHFLVPSGLGHPTLEGNGEEQTASGLPDSILLSPVQLAPIAILTGPEPSLILFLCCLKAFQSSPHPGQSPVPSVRRSQLPMVQSISCPTNHLHVLLSPTGLHLVFHLSPTLPRLCTLLLPFTPSLESSPICLHTVKS